jgi:hypothetical protein
MNREDAVEALVRLCYYTSQTTIKVSTGRGVASKTLRDAERKAINTVFKALTGEVATDDEYQKIVGEK